MSQKKISSGAVHDMPTDLKNLGLAEMGWQVLGGDSCAPLISQLRAGKMPFYEPGLADLLAKHLGKTFLPVDDLETVIGDTRPSECRRFQ